MANNGKPEIERLGTGVPTLDDILHGGFPSGTLNIITGGPGAGKSILALQILFHQARRGKRDIYMTSILEPSVKFLRYMQQFDFFDPDLVGKHLFLADLSGPALSQGLEETIVKLKGQIQQRGPAVIAIDSFKALRSRLTDPSAAHPILYDLVVHLAVSDVTALLVGEYDADDLVHLPEFFAADGIIDLTRVTEGLRVSRQMEVQKLRGSGYSPGRHFFEISQGGITVYPRVSVPAETEEVQESESRVPTGVPGLDVMLGGGLPTRTSTVLEGSSGTGKTTLALSFLMEGARRGEPGLYFTMDETREQLIQMGTNRGWEIRRFMDQGLLEVVYTSPLDLVADAVLHKARDLVGRMGAKRAVIDSISALQLSIAAQGRGTELVYALVKSIRSLGVTAILINEAPQLLGTIELSAHGLSAVADNIILLRYAEVESRFTRALTVLKVRGSGHEQQLRELVITADSISVGDLLQQSRGVLTGRPTAEGQGTGAP